MYQPTNNRELARHLLVKAGSASVAIVDLQSAAGYVETYGKPSLPWQTAAVAIEHAHLDPSLIEHATQSLENALRMDNLLVG